VEESVRGPGICLEGLKKTMEIRNQDSRSAIRIWLRDHLDTKQVASHWIATFSAIDLEEICVLLLTFSNAM
jgi:hypothetical protein